jgi:phenylacetate-CoA ligase
MKPLYGRAYEWLFRRVLYPLYEERLRGRRTLRWMQDMMARDSWPREQLARYQLEQMKGLLSHAHQQVPWYRERMDEAGFVPEDMTACEQVAALPVLTKALVKEHYQELIARDYRGRTFAKVTGGSTGVPFRFEITREDYERRMAVMWRGYARAGARMGRRTLYLWGADILPTRTLAGIKNHLYHSFFQRRMLNSFALTEANLPDYYRQVRAYRPAVVVAYVSPLYQLACYMLANNLRVPGVSSILTGAEPLHEFQRDVIARAFQAPVYNTYGCREVMLLASEAPGVSGLLINSDQFYLEALGDQGVAVHDAPGELLITDLHARGMPFIRYSNGDRVSLASPDQSAAGYPWPLMHAVEGRQLDVIRTPDGALLPGEFFPHLLKDIPGVAAFQVIQHRLDSLVIKLQVSADYDADAETLLRRTVQARLGDAMHLLLEYVTEIPLTASGKRRVTMSMLDTDTGERS